MRLALSLTVLLLALTAVAFVQDRDAETAPAPTAAAAGAPTPAPSVAHTPLLEADALERRIREQVMEPLNRTRRHLGSFSRVARPSREVLFRWVDRPTSQAPVPRFRIDDPGNAFAFTRNRRERPLATGRIDRRTGGITLAVGAEPNPGEDRYQEVAVALRALGVR